MKILLDTSDVQAIKRIAATFPVWGVTTNPAIVATGRVQLFDLLPAIRDALGGKGTLFAQVISSSVEGMITDAQKLYERVDNLVVKVPVTPKGLQVIKELSAQNIPTLATAVYGSAQGLLGILAGAKYVSPYVSRIDAQGGNGPEVVSELQSLLSMHAPESELIAASFKSPRQALECMLIGCKGITLSPEVFDLFLADPAVAIAVTQFEEKWKGAFSTDCL
ncbi:Transaldolase/fructose-6-phosphate aldolase (TalA) (PDB:1F05) [Commensalibacter communis]|uniref:Transaldolase/fructose-6-phosphate aldolase (TalA) n=1 Tax=Commensalibacter communis TaxID=2972786 RepID=A0A9W4TMD9_9PROT|nr:transaldolase family protein [Commensalibacter communis]CAI3923891.1 Transaldolase/fructose-6-phosphate aldolase (TalA) (PDB:1F05) [Commensalibacter communis]CAI3923908.1 Transaldolase/fructose-6-phosphate aldolase (TalA) (PDB:1F05) [Commensalibacter communis]CAI3929457.1 Transaldolase/fructose-6-phosphate aldolase (TalA) (PDB:1F05) [Commensalibacter communis]CAI3930787.1 Transaldolase/fructose-6-phosphate aldolase (TalA) (PDB:1F05) [Commensalibacter communis]CAI3930989.1 Transaldolase/fruc